MNKNQIANELSKIYLENYLKLETQKCNRNYNLDEITRMYLSIYKQILKILIDSKIFNNSINQIAYSISLLYLNMKENIYDDITLYTGHYDTTTLGYERTNNPYLN